MFKLTINLETRRGGTKGKYYADHYLTYPNCSSFWQSDYRNIDYTKCWAFETKGRSNTFALNTTIVQCHRYSALYYNNPLNRVNKYVSIITDARIFKLWYACWENGDMKGGETKHYKWSKPTLDVLARVFKTIRKTCTHGVSCCQNTPNDQKWTWGMRSWSLSIGSRFNAQFKACILHWTTVYTAGSFGFYHAMKWRIFLIFGFLIIPTLTPMPHPCSTSNIIKLFIKSIHGSGVAFCNEARSRQVDTNLTGK